MSSFFSFAGSFVSSAGINIMDTLQGMGYFDRNEISQINASYIPGLKLVFTSEMCSLQSSTTSYNHNEEIGMLYKLKYGEIGARVVCKSCPIAQLTGALRLFSNLSGFKLTSMGVVDVNSHKLKDWNIGFESIAGNASAQIKLGADEYVFLTRHRIHPKFVALAEFHRPFVKPSRMSTFGIGFEWELYSRATLEGMFSNRHPATFAFQYELSKPQCQLRVSGDLYSKRIGLSLAFHPSSVF
ncbi:hypothetical protein CARUB_v10016501mg [Capsella rubella]|uniref:Bacterial surface antigen (D15) domain-containing protein n=1 Tax=Capsella rubella TaxID=81985 RepID=R0HZS6_9BRAS|nr:uncharacterized protein LOC17892708 [Capsella rubella]EOA29573.1 hypothetical protein CARUB_v10016501mg [Capsella rubella]